MARRKPEETLLIGVDVGGTHVRVGVVQSLSVIWEKRFAAHFSRRCDPQRPEEAESIVQQVLREAIAEALAEHPRAQAVGLAVPGFLDPETGRLASSPNIPGVRDADLGGPLSAALERPVAAENDALAAAVGEHALHPEHPASLVYMGLGTGVGGGLVLEGEPYRGRHGVAMEVGHLILEPGGRECGCGNRGCMEKYASATGVSLSYEHSTGQRIEAKQVAERAWAGDGDALAAFERAGAMLAAGSAHLLKVLDVPDLVVGGGLSRSWRLMEGAFDTRLDEDLIPVLRGGIRLRISESGDQAGMIGAAVLGERQLA